MAIRLIRAFGFGKEPTAAIVLWQSKPKLLRSD